MSLILGINAFHADSAAVLLDPEGRVFGIAEERLNRVKHFAGFPALAVNAVLREAGATLRDVDTVAVARDGQANLRAKLAFALRNAARLPRLARQRLANRADVASTPDLIRALPGGDAARFEVVNLEHHLAHAASAFFASGFERAAILTVDGFGDFASVLRAVGEGTSIRVIDRVLFPHSLGVLYTAVCQFIGFDRYGDEGKVMGLAPYGEDAYAEVLDDMVRETPGGGLELELSYFRHHTEGVDYDADGRGHPCVGTLYSPRLTERLGPPRRREEPLTRRERDLARSLQARLERAYVALARDLQERTGLADLCLAGGVALNSVANGLVLERTRFQRLFVQPAAGDDGTALGAALWVRHARERGPRGEAMDHAYIGRSWSDGEVEAALAPHAEALEVTRLELPRLLERTAEALARGEVVGWFQGRSEWGPRALGNRSILAHPGFPGMKDLLNARIKHREPFRPFAPAILAEELSTCFEASHPSPFMLMVYRTRPEWRERLSAVNHVDDTGRVQTVTREANPRFHALLRRFEACTGIPVLLNTSFNENEPIVDAPGEAVDCFLRTRMDALVLGDRIVTRRSSLPGRPE